MSDTALAPGPYELAREARDRFRNERMRTEDLAAGFATDAVAWHYAQGGLTALSPRQPTAGPSRDDPFVLPADLLAAQRTWLAVATPDQVATYLPDLVRGLAQGPQDADHLSAEPITDLVVAALTARLRLPAEDRETVLYDPVCGTGGILAAAAVRLRREGATVAAYGQDVNPGAAYMAQCAQRLADWPGSVVRGNCLTEDELPEVKYDYAVADPPFGVGWRHQAESIHAQHARGAFPAGLPAQSDATWLFVQHLTQKMRPESEGGGRAVVVVTAGALRNNGSEAVRQWMLDMDLLEAIIGLPEGMSPFGRGSRLNALVLTNRRPAQRRGLIQVIDLRGAFENRPSGRLTRRRLRPDALASLQHALSTIKPGPISRTVPTDRFMERTVTIRTQAPAGTARNWRLSLSLADDPASFVARHVQAPPSEVTDTNSVATCRLDVNGIFSRDATHIDAWIRERRWSFTRLAALVEAPTYVAPSSSEERSRAMQQLPPGPRVMLPIEADRPAVYGDPATAAPDGRFLAFTCPDTVNDEFLVGYLNSRNGKLARRAALESLGGSASARPALRAGADFLALMVVPVPDEPTQQNLIDADSAVQAAVGAAQRAAEDLWRSPERHAEILRQFERPAQAETLADWAQQLPYPLATALWAAETKKGNEDARNRQLFHFWDAAAAFHGTILLSALDQDEALRDSEMATMRTALAASGLSMQRATLGAWLILTQRLGSRFRGMLDSPDADERARVQTLFAGAPDELVRALCGTGLASLLQQVTQRRNDWSGHGGAVADHVLADRNAWLVAQIDTLREIVGGAWASAPLVRAGHASYEDGLFKHDVERVMGLNTPFLTQTVTVAAPMTRGQLYVVTDGAQRGLLVEPFVQLRESPASAQYACYFYNRLVGEQARLVSYHLGGEGELLELLPGLSNLVAGFGPSEQAKS